MLENPRTQTYIPKQLLVQYLQLNWWGEAVTDQTLYGLQTKALIITLQTWLMSSGSPFPSHTLTKYNFENISEFQTWLKSKGLSVAICSCCGILSVLYVEVTITQCILKSFILLLYKQRCIWSAKPCIFTARPNLTTYCSLILKDSPYSKTKEPNALQSTSVNKRFFYCSK